MLNSDPPCLAYLEVEQGEYWDAKVAYSINCVKVHTANLGLGSMG